MYELREALHECRKTRWDHTAVLLATIKRVAGDKSAKVYNPYDEVEKPTADQAELRKQFKSQLRSLKL